jgi:hypothetical protein
MPDEATGSPDDPLFLTNMSVRALGCKPRLVKDKPILICRIWGLASEVKSGEDRRTGTPWTALAGEFAGVNLQDGVEDYGKSFRSGKLFLPGGIQEVVEKAVSEMKRDKTGSGSVRFALELFSAAAVNPSGYTYHAKNIMKVESIDPLTELMKSLPPTAAPKTSALKPPPKAA